MFASRAGPFGLNGTSDAKSTKFNNADYKDSRNGSFFEITIDPIIGSSLSYAHRNQRDETKHGWLIRAEAPSLHLTQDALDGRTDHPTTASLSHG
jgi:hypothetical protein